MKFILLAIASVLGVQGSVASYKLEEAINWGAPGLDLSDTFSLAEGIGVSYSVGFVSPEDTTINTKMASTYRMVLSNGTAYRCGVVGPDASAVPSVKRKKMTVEETQEEARKTLDTMGDWCAQRTEGWWTYEVCYGSLGKPSHVRQYHVVEEGEVLEDIGKTDFTLGKDCLKAYPFDPLGKKEGMIARLGYFDGLVERSDKKRPTGIQGKSSDTKYVWDVCKGGDTCEFSRGWAGYGSAVHGAPRETEVRYGCGPAEKPELVDVQEPSSCRYVFDVRFQGMCEVDGLVGEVLPVRQIECWQVGEEDV